MIELGSKVKDKVTGFEGIATARTEWLTGCVRISVQPIVRKGGSLKAEEWFDESRLKVLTRPTAELRAVRALGGPQRDPALPRGPSN